MLAFLFREETFKSHLKSNSKKKSMSVFEEKSLVKNVEQTLKDFSIDDSKDVYSYRIDITKTGISFLENLTHDGKDALLLRNETPIGQISKNAKGFLPLVSPTKIVLQVKSDFQPTVKIKGIYVHLKNVGDYDGVYEFDNKQYLVNSGWIYLTPQELVKSVPRNPTTEKDLLLKQFGIKI